MLVEGLEDGVAADGGEGGHVEGATNLGAPALDMTCALTGATVVVKRCQAAQCGDATAVGLTEFWQLGEQVDRGSFTDSFDLAEPLEFFREWAILADQLGHLRVQSRDLLRHDLDQLVELMNQAVRMELLALGALQASSANS